MSRTADLPDSLALALRANMGPIRIRGGLDYREKAAEFTEHVEAFERQSLTRGDDRSRTEIGKWQLPSPSEEQGKVERNGVVEDAAPSLLLDVDLQNVRAANRSFDLEIREQPLFDARDSVNETGDDKPFSPAVVLPSTVRLSVVELRGETSALSSETSLKGEKSGQPVESVSRKFLPDNAPLAEVRFNAMERHDRPPNFKNTSKPNEIPGSGEAKEVVWSPSRSNVTTRDSAVHKSAAGSLQHLNGSAESEIIKVVRNEMHFPAPRPVEQIANAILGKGQVPIGNATASLSQLGLSLSQKLQTVRMLQVQLDPPELGTITVRLRLASTALDISVEAGQQETAELIRRDQEALARLLRSAGYDIERLTIHAVAESERSLSQTTSQGQQLAVQQGAFQSSTGGSSAEGRSGHTEQQWPQKEPRSRTDTLSQETSDTTSQPRNGIYV